MKFSWSKPKQDPYIYTWESEPFAFVPGQIYVIEVDTLNIQLSEAQELSKFFAEQGVRVKLVLTQGGKALNPVKVKRKKEYDA